MAGINAERGCPKAQSNGSDDVEHGPDHLAIPHQLKCFQAESGEGGEASKDAERHKEANIGAGPYGSVWQ